MLPKENRLKKKGDFDKIHQEGKFYGTKFVAIKLVKNSLSVSRFGFLVGLKISKRATVRNRIKRRLREIIRLNIDKIKAGYDVIFMVKPEIIGKDYQEVEANVLTVLKIAGLWKS